MKFVFAVLVFILSGHALEAQTAVKKADVYQCIPCGHDCDRDEYAKGGKCPHCDMKLVKKSSIVFNTISPEALCDYLQQHPEAVVLDVRTKAEFEGKTTPRYGAIRNAVNIPIQELEKRLPEIASMKNKDVIVYCSHSVRSPQACYLLTQNGFTSITNMSGGISTMGDAACKE
jgi:rhodanese-related sulfurtransferase/DNA-directed RNA polymerase subunit RPC12/RpoP